MPAPKSFFEQIFSRSDRNKFITKKKSDIKDKSESEPLLPQMISERKAREIRKFLDFD